MKIKCVNVFRIVFSTIILFLPISKISAADSVETSPLYIYSGGVSIGAIRAINDELSDQSKQFLKLSFNSRIFFQDHVDLFIDCDWFLPNRNIGADFGLHYYIGKEKIRPFIGMGAGAHYFYRDTGSFGDKIGPSATLHAGMLLNVSKTVQIELMFPYHIVFNEDMDHGMGLQIGIVFSSKYRNVRKLHL